MWTKNKLMNFLLPASHIRPCPINSTEEWLISIGWTKNMIVNNQYIICVKQFQESFNSFGLHFNCPHSQTFYAKYNFVTPLLDSLVKYNLDMFFGFHKIPLAQNTLLHNWNEFCMLQVLVWPIIYVRSSGTGQSETSVFLEHHRFKINVLYHQQI